MSNRIVVAVVAVVVVIYLLISSMYVINPREQAIVTRFGKITQIHSQPGLYFKVPTSLIDNVQIIENRLLRYDIANMTLQVKGGQFYEVDAFLTYRISDPRKFREKAQGSLNVVEQRIGTRFNSALRQVYGLREFSAALSAQRTEMMQEVRKLITPDMSALGIDIVDVRILRTDLTKQVSAQTYARMKSERLAEAALLRANGQQAAQSLRAIADRQSIEILADARKDSDILRGEGDGERSAIYAKAYDVNPEFYDFYRSLQAYRTAMASNTTMVLSPSGDFFRYFGSNTDVTAGMKIPKPPATPAKGPVIQPSTGTPAAAPGSKANPVLDSSPTPSPTGTAPPIPVTNDKTIVGVPRATLAAPGSSKEVEPLGSGVPSVPGAGTSQTPPASGATSAP